MVRAAICVVAVIAYFVWAATYIAPYVFDALSLDAALRQIMHAAIPY